MMIGIGGEHGTTYPSQSFRINHFMCAGSEYIDAIDLLGNAREEAKEVACFFAMSFY